MFSSYCHLYPASHNTLIEIGDVCARPGTIYASFSSSGVPSMSRSHVCVDLSLDPSGRLIEIGFFAGCKLFTGLPGRKKITVAPASAIASLFVIFIRDVRYDVSIVLGVPLLMIVVLSSSSSFLSVASSANLL